MIHQITLLILTTVVQNEAARILAVFPTPSSSHQSVFRALTQEIAKRGHEVTFITPLPAFPKGGAHKNLIEIDVGNETMSTWEEKRMTNAIGPSYLKSGIEITINSIMVIFERQIKNPQVVKIIESGQKFDLLLFEGWLRMPLVFLKFFNAPVIKVNSLGASLDNDYTFGTPIHPVIFPRLFQYKAYNMTLWDIACHIQHTFSVSRIMKTIANKEDAMFRRVFGEDFPSIGDLPDNNHMLFINIHRYWEGNHPMPMSVKHIGGIHLKPAKELPKDLQTYMDASKQGVIYVSFGTNVVSSRLPKELVTTFMKVFDDVPYNVIWRWEVDNLPGQAKNIKFVNWVPQADLLRHPNLKLFITQAGMQSTEEAIAACVPLIGIPLIADQFFNAETYVKHGIGVNFEVNEISEKDLRESIDLLIRDDSYRQRVCKLRDIVNDLPRTPSESMAWWVDHILKHQGSHLRAPAANLPPYEYYEVQLLAITITCLVTVIFVVCFIVYFILLGMF